MPDFIALDWEKHQINGVDAQLSKGKVHVKRCFRLLWSDDFDPVAQPGKAARWLREELQRLGVGGRQVLISLPREATVVRQLKVPNVADAELPDLVRLQAETKSSSSLDQFLLDFLPLPHSVNSTTRQVLMATISRELADRLRSLTGAAGLELVSIGLCPVSTAELVARVENRRNDDPHRTTLVVARQGPRVEISIMQQRQLLFTHSTQLAGTSEQQDNQLIMAEINRSFGAVSRLDVETDVARVWAIGTESENRTLCEALQERLACEIWSLDPLSDAEISCDSPDDSANHAQYAGPIGLLLATAEPAVEAIDFLNPRQTVVKTDRRKLYAGMAAAALLLIAGGAFVGLKLHLSKLDAEIEERQAEVNALDKAIENGQPQLRSMTVVNEWNERNIKWLNEMLKLTEVLPGTDRIYLADVRFNPSAGATVAQIEANGFARDWSDVEQLQQKLKSRNYEVQPAKYEKNNSDDSGYPYRFVLSLRLVPEEPTGGGKKSSRTKKNRKRRNKASHI